MCIMFESNLPIRVGFTSGELAKLKIEKAKNKGYIAIYKKF